MYALSNNATYFDSFGVEDISTEIKIFIDKYIVETNVFRRQAYDSIMRGYSCNGFINSMLAGKTWTDFTNLFSPNNFLKNDDMILNYFFFE